ncbi:M48 family metalloprotease [Gilvimarinus sp. F26214L]|uniref:M48 family metalloprotease n=1 Tax=Gilvimarinus sp. DZF01 TaxID=3461371 RepID=UPI00404601E8
MRKFLAACVASAVLLSGCSENPVTGESEFSLISAQQEVAIGQQNYQPSVQAQGGRYMVDPDLTPYVNSVGQKLAEVSDRPNLPYEFVVLNNDVPNAWALPGGKIAVNRGLLLHLQDESQLAAVLAHEIVHAAARHSANQMTQGALLGIGSQVIGQVARDSDYNQLIALGTGLSAAAWQARYGRNHELESDRYGMEYMARAGYDPRGAVELQETFVQLSNNQRQDFLSGLFASHPPSQERVEANRQHARNLAGSARNKEAFQRATARIRQDKEAYDVHQQAVAAVNDKDLDQGLALVNRAIERQPRESHFWETKGYILAAKKQPDEALDAYDHAIELYPEYFSPYIGRASVHQASGNPRAAKTDLLQSQQYLDTPITNYFLGQVSRELGETREAVQYFQVAASAGGEVGQAARAQLQQMGVAPAAQ